MKDTRLPNVKIGKRIVVGTYAFPLNPSEKKRYGSMTHRWVCLLRSLDDENMTHYVKRVQFDLDPSFLNPRRVLSSMPYEVTEVGWGEFFIGVKITFVDETLEPITLQHLLRLNPSDGTNTITTAVNETFDEIVFNEPNQWFYEKLLRSACDKLPPSKYRDYFWNYEQKEKETICRYICSQSYFQNETYRLLAEASELCKQIQHLQEQSHFGTKSPAIPMKDKSTKSGSSVGSQQPLTPNQGNHMIKEQNLGDLPIKKLHIPGVSSPLEPKVESHDQGTPNLKPISRSDRDSLYSDRSQGSHRSK